jgi:hypothetical protein
MNPMSCKYEPETIRALQDGSPGDELLRHQSTCPECRQALWLAQAFQKDAGRLTASCAPPQAAQIWATAEHRRRTAALERAALILRALKASGMLYAAIFVLWGLHWLAGLKSSFLLPGLDAKALTTTLAGAGLAACFVITGLCYVLRRDETRAG